MTTPLVPSHVDLRDFAYMPLDVLRLRDSDLAAESNDAEFRAAVMLWCASWHQLPAASLPDNDAILTRLAGFGRDVDGWKKVRDGALRGWIRCDDGRLYHPVVAEKANQAWEQKQKQRARTAAARAARLSQSGEAHQEPVATVPVTENVTASKGTERNGIERKEEKERTARERAASFERFWAVYPNKVGKPDAAKSFFRVAGEIEAILDGLQRYIREKPPDRSWLNPSTFLNQRRWEDAPAKVESPNGRFGNQDARKPTLAELERSFIERSRPVADDRSSLALPARGSG